MEMLIVREGHITKAWQRSLDFRLCLCYPRGPGWEGRDQGGKEEAGAGRGQEGGQLSLGISGRCLLGRADPVDMSLFRKARMDSSEKLETQIFLWALLFLDVSN